MSIYKSGSRWRYEFDVRINGQRLRKRRLLPAGWSREQAAAYAQKESAGLHSIAHGIAKPRHTIGQAVERYIAERIPSLKAGRKTAREIGYMDDWYADRSIDELPIVCQEYAQDQLGALAPATIRNRIAYLRAACRWAWKRHGMGESDPGARVQAPTANNARQVTVSRAEMIRLARACTDRGTRALIRIAYYSGLRLGEQYAAKRVAGMFVLADSKTGKPRIVPIHPRISSASKVPMTPRTQVDYWWRKARAVAGLENVTLHDLRHAAASAMVDAGVDLGTVGAVLGHQSAQTTKRYAHHGVARLAEAVGKIGKKRA